MSSEIAPREALVETRQWAIVIPVREGEEGVAGKTLLSVLASSSSEAPIVLLSAAGVFASLHSEVADSHAVCHETWEAGNDMDPFYAAVSSGARRFPGRDIVIAMPGVLVPRNWDTRLAWSAGRNVKIASVSPLCDVSALHRLGERNSEETRDLEPINNSIYSLGARSNFELPVLLCACVYLRGDILARALSMLNRNKQEKDHGFYAVLSRAFQDLGAYNVVCDHVFVNDLNELHAHWMSLTESLDDVQKTASVHPLMDLRHAYMDARGQGLMAKLPGPRDGPVQLHVSHSWGGGLGQWVEDYCQGDTTGANFVLRSVGTWGAFGEALELFSSHELSVPILRWQIRYPIRGSAISNMQYKEILDEIIDRFAIDAILVSSLVGHSLDVLRTECDTLVVHHDYYPFCPSFNITFNGVCGECDLQKLNRCFKENEHNRFFINVSGEEIIKVRDEFARLVAKKGVRLVAPSVSVVNNFKTLWPQLSTQALTVIPHGIRFRRLGEPLSDVSSSGDRLRVVVLGRLLQHKGRSLLYEALPYLSEFADLYLLGCGESGDVFRGRPGVHLIEDYALEDLERHLREIAPHVGALLSVMPETFSYALSELMLMAIPVVATRIGSFEDRIDDGSTGFLIEPEAGALVEKLRALNADRELLARVSDNTRDTLARDRGAMVRDYQTMLVTPGDARRRYFAESVWRHLLRGQVDAAEAASDMYIVGNPAYKVVLSGFLDYTERKFKASRRIGARVKNLIWPILSLFFNMLRKLAD